MPDKTNEAPAPEVVAVYPDEETEALAQALAVREEAMQAKAREQAGEAEGDSPEDDGTEGGAQAEEVAESAEDEKVEAKRSPVGDGEPEAEADKSEVDLNGLPDEDKDRLLKAREAGVLSEKEIAAWKTRLLKGDGFDKKAREFADQRKALEEQAKRGEQFDSLFSDAAERDKYLAWREQESGETEETALPSFETDEDLVRFVEKRAAEIAEQRVSEVQKRQEAAVEADREAAERMIGAVEGHYETLDGVTPEDYTKACEALNAEIRADGQLPWEILKDSDTVNRKIQPHLDRVQLQRRIEELEGRLQVRENEQSKSESARSAGVSSPIGRSTRTKAEYPDTREGNAARTLAEFEGRIPPDF